MKPIRHLISIVFLFCGLTAWGGERGYDQNDMVGTYKYFGKWEVKEDLVVLHFDEHKDDTLKTHELDKYVMKENEVWKDLIEQVVRDVVG